MKPNRLIVLNINTTDDDVFLRTDLESSLGKTYKIEYINSDELVIDAKSGDVSFVVKNERFIFSDSFIFVRRLRKNSDLPALLCRVLKNRRIPFSDRENSSHQVTTDKSYAIVALADAGLPVPRTMVTNLSGLKANFDYITKNLAFPCVLKGKGSRGEWVFKINTAEELLSQAEDIYSTKECLLSIQELIPNEYDVRALFFGGVFISAMRRTAIDGSFLNNVSQGGLASPDSLSEEEKSLCIMAREIVGIDFAGVDFVRTDKGIFFLEINKSPQLGGMCSVYPDLSVGAALEQFIVDLQSDS